ncbi:hypothetical protein [Streptomyces cinereoruber]|uniref:hypothetical protein n=1 Tax=Streptomyces cinereoruber TaxID=67260 RepID=UPI003C2E0FC7
MSKGNANHRKGAITERMVAAHVRPYWPEVDRRLREGRQDDQGDLDGVPFTCTQVKYWEKPRLQEWVAQTLRQRDAAGVPFCWIVSRVKYKTPGAWDVFMPGHQLGLSGPEEEAWTWVRMDLDLGVQVMLDLILDHRVSR